MSLPRYTLFFYKNVVFPAQAEYSNFFADFRLEIFLYYSLIIAYDISVLEFIGVSITSVSYLDLYRVTFCLCSIAFRCSQRGPNVTSNDTRNSMMETKVLNFVSTMSRTIKCNPCSKLFVNQQGLFYKVQGLFYKGNLKT